MANYVSKHTGEQIDHAVDSVLNGNFDGGSSVEVDATLTKSGAAADAKETGEKIKQLSEEKSDKYMGVENAGAALIVGADGNIAVLVEDAAGEQLTVVAPVRIYDKGNCYVVESTGKMFVSSNEYMLTAAYQVYAGKKYRFKGRSINSSQYTYVMGLTLYDMPESGFNTGVIYTHAQMEAISGEDYEYEIIPESDCYLYVQCGRMESSFPGIDPEQNLVAVTVLPSSKSGVGAKYAVSSDGDGIEISYPYSEDTLTVTLNKRGGNNLFDFRKIETNTEKLFDASSSDWHAPFVVAAVNNADGDTPENQYFTGGNHQTNNTGTGGAVTARTSALQFYADGKLLSAGDAGNAIKVEMRWTNLVQGYNTTKADGNGREILQENHTLTFANGKFETYVEVIPLEAVTMKTWYGLQAVVGSKYPNIRYPGGANRGEYQGNSESGDSTACVMDCYGDDHRMRIEVDPVFDLGKRSDSFAIGTKGAFRTEYGKCYFTIVNKDVSMAAGDMYCLRGSYEFMPR